MHCTPAYVAPAQAEPRTLVGHVMWLVAATTGLFLRIFGSRD